MKVKVLETLKNYDGTPLADTDQPPMSIRETIIFVLNNAPGPLGAEEKMRMYELSKKTYRTKEVDFTKKDITLIETHAAKLLSNIGFGRLSDVFNDVTVEVFPAPRSKLIDSIEDPEN